MGDDRVKSEYFEGKAHKGVIGDEAPKAEPSETEVVQAPDSE